MLQRYACGRESNRIGLGARELGVGTINAGHYRIAWFEPRHQSARPLDCAGDVGANDCRKLQGPDGLHESLANFPVNRIDAGRPDPDQNAVTPDFRRRRILVLENVRLTVFVDTNSFH
jgi:hypothetical protein